MLLLSKFIQLQTLISIKITHVYLKEVGCDLFNVKVKIMIAIL